jgi:hypothetical protein
MTCLPIYLPWKSAVRKVPEPVGPDPEEYPFYCGFQKPYDYWEID